MLVVLEIVYRLWCCNSSQYLEQLHFCLLVDTWLLGSVIIVVIIGHDIDLGTSGMIDEMACVGALLWHKT